MIASVKKGAADPRTVTQFMSLHGQLPDEPLLFDLFQHAENQVLLEYFSDLFVVRHFSFMLVNVNRELELKLDLHCLQ